MILSELRANLWKYACIAAAVLAVAAVLGALYFRGSAYSARADRDAAVHERDQARADRDALVELIAIERSKAAEYARIATEYEQDKARADEVATATADSLRAGNLRLRHEIGALYTAQLSGAAAHSAELAGAAERGAELAGAAIAVGAACDARDRAWRAVAEADRE